MKRVLAIAFLIAVGPAAYAQQCASPVPPLPTSRRANTFEVTCSAKQKCESTNQSACQRCGGPIGGDDCDWMIDTAFSADLIDTGRPRLAAQQSLLPSVAGAPHGHEAHRHLPARLLRR